MAEQLLDSVNAEVGYKDSTIQSYVIIEKRYAETVDLQDVVITTKQERIVKLEKAVRFRNTALTIGVPASLVLGLFGGVWLSR